MSQAPECDHGTNATAHVKRRAWERFGLALSAPELAAIETFIRVGGGRLVREEADGCRVCGLVFRQREIFVIFDPVLDRALTVLPQGWARRERRRKGEGRR